ncbi:O-antigen ligase family protein [Cellvibrio polysaccharolyticus]|uniref:O-antigen ligase domain-containing protein n=1 Tax=Cellvibrio polysaccharolyticus TaxID=2082724 RepID=A0A928YTE0_9GAMM|nr:O-antigen ligase family protein [Cellvibrio polysaccharolyticus]MBE8716235.1 O-antigen ligase domain-containing protein [Cellvibrio polysaccharolyticus]
MVLMSRARREQIALSWAGWGVLLFVTSFIWSPSRDGLDVVFVLFLFLPLLLVLPWQKPSFNEYGGWINLAALGYAGFATLAVSWGSQSGEWGYFVLHWFVLFFWLCGVCWVFSRQQPDMPRFFNITVIIGVVVAISALIYCYSENPLDYRMIGWSVARYPIVVAQIFGSVAVIAYVLSLQQDQIKRSLVYFLATLILLLPLFFSQSRGPALAFIVVILAALVFIRPSLKILLIHALIGVVLLLPVLLFTDLAQVLTQRGFSWSERDNIWHDVWHLAWQTPWVGSGSLADDHMTIPSGFFHHPHNAWLDIFYRNGLVGLALAVTHLALLLRWFSRDKILLPLYLWLCFGCLCLFTDSRVLFWELNAKWFLYWIPAGLITAMLVSRNRQTQRS